MGTFKIEFWRIRKTDTETYGYHIVGRADRLLIYYVVKTLMGIDSADTSQSPNGEICMDKSHLLPSNPARQKYRVTPLYQ